jgi:hypothetical protein
MLTKPESMRAVAGRTADEYYSCTRRIVPKYPLIAGDADWVCVDRPGFCRVAAFSITSVKYIEIRLSLNLGKQHQVR